MARSLRIGLVAGELSGDQLGASLMHALRSLYPEVEFEGVAGPQMRAAGCRAVARSEQLAVMGLAEVLAHLPRLLRLRHKVLRHFLRSPPDVFLGIDAPDFNLPLERSLKRAGITTLHWVSPSVWAWRKYRLAKIRRSVDLMLTLFPFESRFYEQHAVPTEFVGHPLADQIPLNRSRQQARESLGLELQDPCLALLPGSRRSEVKRLLPVFLQAALMCKEVLPQLRFVLPVAIPGLLPLCRKLLGARETDGLGITLLNGQAREAMIAADAVLLASGTAALECMLLERPMVVAYRLHPFSYQVVKRMLQVPYISLPNHLLDTLQVPEYLQGEASPAQLAGAVLELIQHPAKAAQQTAPFAQVRETLSRNAAQQVARRVIDRGIH